MIDHGDRVFRTFLALSQARFSGRCRHVGKQVFSDTIDGHYVQDFGKTLIKSNDPKTIIRSGN